MCVLRIKSFWKWCLEWISGIFAKTNPNCSTKEMADWSCDEYIHINEWLLTGNRLILFRHRLVKIKFNSIGSWAVSLVGVWLLSIYLSANLVTILMTLVQWDERWNWIKSAITSLAKWIWSIIFFWINSTQMSPICDDMILYF